jgi:hypothetical protein
MAKTYFARWLGKMQQSGAIRFVIKIAAREHFIF